MKLSKNEKGITLVALVRTIIVLIILAGVSLNMVNSENGIVEISKDRKNKVQAEQENEEAQIASLSNGLKEETADISIEEMNVTITNTSVQYTGSEQSFNIEVDKEGSAVYYSTDGGANWNLKRPTFVEAGTYTINVKVVNAKYKTNEFIVTFTINP